MMALLAGALIAPELLAQQNPNRPQQPRPGQARGSIGRIAEQLELTEKQREQWAKVVAEQQQKQRALFQNRDTPREQLREKFNALRKETLEKQEKILTKEQLAKYKELSQRRPQPRPGQGPNARPGPGAGAGARPGEGRPGGGRPGGGLGGFGRNLFGDLDLSEKQQEKIEAITQARGDEMREMFEELRNGGGDRQALTAKFRALGEKYQKQIDAVLTDTQKKKLAEMSAQRGQGGRDQGGRGRGNPFGSLNLKEEQQKKLDAARQEMSTQTRALFQDRETPREELAGKMQKIRDAYETKIKGVLTEEQFKKYQESRSSGSRDQGQGQGRRPGQGGFGGSRDPFAGIDGIKEEQKKKLDAARSEMSTGMRGLFQDRDTPREERSAKMEKLRETYEAKVKSILTDEQYKKYQARPQRRPGRGSFGGGRRPEGERPPQNPRPRRDDI